MDFAWVRGTGTLGCFFLRLSELLISFKGRRLIHLYLMRYFFGSDAGDKGSWLFELNVEDQAMQWSNQF